MVGELELHDPWGAFQPKPSYGSMTQHMNHGGDIHNAVRETLGQFAVCPHAPEANPDFPLLV